MAAVAAWCAIALAACVGQPQAAPVPSSTAATTASVAAPTAASAVPAGRASPTATAADTLATYRAAMVEDQMRARDITDEKVLEVMGRVPRHEFVTAEYRSQAYADHPLPIGFGQTISQPYIVALMTQLLDVKRGQRILEIGTGSGYQAAVLAELTDEVYTIEIIPELAASAAERFKRLGYDKIQAKSADGYFGWPEHAPYDAIIVTAAPDHVPQPLIQQLKDGGRMVIPIGPPGSYQTLWQVTKKGDQTELKNITGVSFVPLTRRTQ